MHAFWLVCFRVIDVMVRLLGGFILIHQINRWRTQRVRYPRRRWRPSLSLNSRRTLCSLTIISDTVRTWCILLNHNRLCKLLSIALRRRTILVQGRYILGLIRNLLCWVMGIRLMRKCWRLCKLSRVLLGGRIWWCLGKISFYSLSFFWCLGMLKWVFMTDFLGHLNLRHHLHMSWDISNSNSHSSSISSSRHPNSHLITLRCIKLVRACSMLCSTAGSILYKWRLCINFLFAPFFLSVLFWRESVSISMSSCILLSLLLCVFFCTCSALWS